MQDLHTPKSTRRATRLRVQLPVTVTSLDRRHAFVAECTALVISPQGAGLRATQALPLETPVMLSGLAGGATASARVASCLPLGTDGKFFLIGISLYNPGNIWGIANPPADWEAAPAATTASATSAKSAAPKSEAWPYNVFSGHSQTR